MTEMKFVHIQLGDWVSGTSVNDERFRGYVEAVSKEQGSALVRVIESDRDTTVGRVVESSLMKLERLSEEGWRDDQGLMSLIDLALETHDHAWFLELTTSLLALRSPKQQAARAPIVMHKRTWQSRL
ncbi:IDEAL domain protein [compost metagenome]